MTDCNTLIDRKGKRRCIIVPAFNEAENIGAVIEGIRKESDADIVVIEDGSIDLTGEKARKAGAFVITHPFNLGYGAALQTGYKYGLKENYDFLLQMDGDGQHDPKSIPELFREVETGGCDVAIGSRFLGKKSYPIGSLKSLGIKLFRGVIRLVTGQTITDPTSGYQCLNRHVFRVFTEDLFPCDYPDANIIILLHRMGYRIKEVPVAMLPNPEGRSMHRGLFRVPYYFFEMFLSLSVTLLRDKKGR